MSSQAIQSQYFPAAKNSLLIVELRRAKGGPILGEDTKNFTNIFSDLVFEQCNSPPTISVATGILSYYYLETFGLKPPAQRLISPDGTSTLFVVSTSTKTDSLATCIEDQQNKALAAAYPSDAPGRARLTGLLAFSRDIQAGATTELYVALMMLCRCREGHDPDRRFRITSRDGCVDFGAPQPSPIGTAVAEYRSQHPL